MFKLMKSKITISIDDKILSKIDVDVKSLKGKNRSQIIENLLKERYGDFTDVTAIIFAHDYKWDDEDYPFDIPKAFLEVKGQTIIISQLEIFVNSGIKNIIMLIPYGTKDIFNKKLGNLYSNVDIIFFELDSSKKTGTALKEALKLVSNNRKLLISNGDIYFGDLNLIDYFDYFKEQNADFAFLLKFEMNPESLGNVKINGNKVIGYVEKPEKNMLFLTNSGLYITTTNFLKKFDIGSYLENDFFPKLPNLGSVVGYVYSSEWYHVQSTKTFNKINNL